MEVSEVRINLVETGDAKLKAFVTITLDNTFVVRDLKIIEGKKGLFVAMPSVKVMIPCPDCKKKNPIRSKYCNDCGSKQDEPAKPESEEAIRDEHRDIAHPINAETREYIQNKVLREYEAEKSNVTSSA